MWLNIRVRVAYLDFSLLNSYIPKTSCGLDVFFTHLFHLAVFLIISLPVPLFWFSCPPFFSQYPFFFFLPSFSLSPSLPIHLFIFLTFLQTYNSGNSGGGVSSLQASSQKRLDDSAARFTNANFQEVSSAHSGSSSKDALAADSVKAATEVKNKKNSGGGHTVGPRGGRKSLTSSGKPLPSAVVTMATSSTSASASTGPFHQGELMVANGSQYFSPPTHTWQLEKWECNDGSSGIFTLHTHKKNCKCIKIAKRYLKPEWTFDSLVLWVRVCCVIDWISVGHQTFVSRRDKTVLSRLCNLGPRLRTAPRTQTQADGTCGEVMTWKESLFTPVCSCVLRCYSLEALVSCVFLSSREIVHCVRFQETDAREGCLTRKGWL